MRFVVNSACCNLPLKSSRFSPRYLIEPEVAGSNCKIALPRVDLPQPDSPTKPKVSPGYNLKLTSLTALKLRGLLNHPEVLKYSFSRLISITFNTLNHHALQYEY